MLPKGEISLSVGPDGPKDEITNDSQDLHTLLGNAFHELSQPVSALWCALEIATLRAPDPEEDRQDLLAALAMAEELGKRLRGIRNSLELRRLFLSSVPRILKEK